MVDVEVDFFSPVEGEIVRVDAFLALLAETLLEVGADDVCWIFFLILFFFKSVDVIVKGVKERLFLLFFLFLLSLLELFGLEQGHGDSREFDSLLHSFHEPK